LRVKVMMIVIAAVVVVVIGGGAWHLKGNQQHCLLSETAEAAV